jgi:hypothetical protein
MLGLGPVELAVILTILVVLILGIVALGVIIGLLLRRR